jgi:hypothetical protein
VSQEVYVLPDSANASIPKDIRDRFHTDELGRVLFFTGPPVETDKVSHSGLRHSASYLAKKIKREQELKEQKAGGNGTAKPFTQSPNGMVNGVNGSRSPHADSQDNTKTQQDRILEAWAEQALGDLISHYQARFGENWYEEGVKENERLAALWSANVKKRKWSQEEEARKRRAVDPVISG